MSMAHSLSVKTPFMHPKIIDLALSLPINLRVTKAKNKIVFRETAKKYLPKNVADKKKWGFPVPLRLWLRQQEFYKFTKEYFTNETAKKYFHTSKILHLLERHKNGKADNSRKIWTVLMFLIWHKQFFESGEHNETTQ
jgi:asparagine synthase (glutamine-hydrolysing)